MSRQETDSLGRVIVADDKLWGAQTQRALENFGQGILVPWEIIVAYAIIKDISATVNFKLKVLSKKDSQAIVCACAKIVDDKLVEHFPLTIFQSGSGTQTNMNVNEVIVNLVKRDFGIDLSANDQVNASQSSNDTFTMAVHIATYFKMKELFTSLISLEKELSKKVVEFSSVTKLGRTHLMDATSLSVGQEFSGYLAQVKQLKKRLNSSLEYISQLPVGGTAVGTGINCPKGFDKIFIEKINKKYKSKFKISRNKFKDIASLDSLHQLMGDINSLASICFKLSSDLALLSSGPMGGIGEYNLPSNEPGSSIMPGKINPTQCESLKMACVKVMGQYQSVSIANASGQLQLNTFKPLISYEVLGAIDIMSKGIYNFNRSCLSGLKLNLKRIKANLDNSLMGATLLNKVIGYSNASKAVLNAQHKNISLKASILELDFLSEEEYNRVMGLKKKVKE